MLAEHSGLGLKNSRGSGGEVRTTVLIGKEKDASKAEAGWMHGGDPSTSS